MSHVLARPGLNALVAGNVLAHAVTDVQSGAGLLSLGAGMVSASEQAEAVGGDTVYQAPDVRFIPSSSVASDADAGARKPNAIPENLMQAAAAILARPGSGSAERFSGTASAFAPEAIGDSSHISRGSKPVGYLMRDGCWSDETTRRYTEGEREAVKNVLGSMGSESKRGEAIQAVYHWMDRVDPYFTATRTVFTVDGYYVAKGELKFEALREALRSRDASLRERAVRVLFLYESREEERAKLIVGALKDENKRVRSLAEGICVLRPGLVDPVLKVAKKSEGMAEVVQEIQRKREAIEKIKKLTDEAEEGDPHAQIQALKALHKIGGFGIRELLDDLSYAHRAHRWYRAPETRKE